MIFGRHRGDNVREFGVLRVRTFMVASGPPSAPATRFGEDKHGVVQDFESLRAIDGFVDEQSITVNGGI